MTGGHLSGVPPWTTLVQQRLSSPSIIRPRKEAPKERLETLIRSVGPDVNLVGIGSETPSHYLRTGRTADRGYTEIGRASCRERVYVLV